VSIQEEEIGSNESLGIYPNPVQNEFRIALPSSSGQGKWMRIFDARGQLIYDGNFVAHYSLESAPSGFYHLTVLTTDDKIWQGDFVVSK
jgi:hypothetical protein